MKLKQKTRGKTAQEIQDDIFRKMSAARKLSLASDFSRFVLGLNGLNKDDGFSKTTGKNCKDSK